MESRQEKIFVHPDGSVVRLPKLPARALRGFLKHRGRPVTLDEMDDGIRAGATGESFGG
jgi:hypothetical protein